MGLTLPWWMGTVLRWQGGQHGLSFSEYQAIGYFRWAVTDVRVVQPGFDLTIDRLEAPHPLSLWLEQSAAGPISMGEVRVMLRAGAVAPAADANVMTPGELHAMIHRYAGLLPKVQIGSLELVEVAPQPLQLDAVSWERFALKVDRIAYVGQEAKFLAQMNMPPGYDSPEEQTDPGPQTTIALGALDESWRGEINYLDPGTGDYEISLNGSWEGRTVLGDMTLSPNSWMPDTLHLNLSNWVLAGEDVGLDQTYETVSGTADFDWREGRFTLAAQADGRVQLATGQARIKVDVLAAGSLEETLIETLDVQFPGLTLSLDNPLRISNRDYAAETTSEFTLQADLASLPWGDGMGQLQGAARVTSRGMAWPRVEFGFSADAVSWEGVTNRVVRGPVSADVAGVLQWPAWEISETTIKAGDGSGLVFAGRGEQSRIEASNWSIDLGGASLIDELTATFTAERIEAMGSLSGVQPDWQHAGTITVSALQVPALHPLDVSGEWSGTGVEVLAQTFVESGKGRMELSIESNGDSAKLQGSLAHDAQQLFRTQRAGMVAWAEGWAVSDLSLIGSMGEISIRQLKAQSGDLQLALNHPKGDWFADWLVDPPTLPVIRELTGEIAWDETALTGNLRFDGDVHSLDGEGVRLTFAAISDGQIINVTGGELGWQDDAVARVEGALPIKLTAQAPYWEVDPAGAIDARLVLIENQKVWDALNRNTRVKLENPRLEVDLAGTWNRPRGQGYFALDRLTFAEDEAEATAWPVITAVEAKLIDDGEGLEVDPVTAKVDGQRVTLRGELPFTPEAWTKLSEDPLAYFRDQGRGEVSVPRAELSAFAKFLPEYLVPTGEIEVALNYSPGMGINGRIQLKDVVSKPLGPLGILQNIAADLRFENRTMTIENVTALMGGQPMAIAGTAAWPAEGEVELELTLQGENLPLVRKTGVLLRSDLDLKLVSDAMGKGTVSGNARLRDGLVLVDVRSLVPRGGGSVEVPSRRPPYFSVTVPPLNGWELDVELRGENFLRLRTPVIAGVGSVRARLDGTLEYPRLLGEMELREAGLRLPFARLDVDEAIVRLTEADPYDPEIFLQASGQRLGYDLQLELTGKVSEPQLNLQSSPTLTSEEVLMLVMAGVTPNDDSDLLNADRAMRLGLYFGQGILGDLLGTDERERLTVSTGEQLSRLGKETYRFEYEIADRWAVVGEYDEFDYYNAAVKWRVRPGKAKPAPPDPAEPKEDQDE